MPNLTKKAYSLEWDYRKATQLELLEFKKILRPLITNAGTPTSQIQKKLLAKLQQDRGLIDSLGQALDGLPEIQGVSWKPKIKKILENIDGGITFIKDRSKFYAFIQSIQTGHELEEHLIKTNKQDVPLLENINPSIYSTSKGCFFKTVLINTYLIFAEIKQLGGINLKHNKKGRAWIDQTPNAHIISLPNTLKLEDINFHEANITECSYFYSDEKTPQGIIYLHSGYTINGDRCETRYAPHGKPFAPESCTSWIGKLTLGIDNLSTADLWNRWKWQKEEYNTADNWETTSVGQLLISKLIPLETSTEDITAGLIWAARSFDLSTDPEKKGDGKNGHVALIVEKADKNNDTVKTLGYRNGSGREGCGIENFPIYAVPHSASTADKQFMFFKINPKPSRPLLENSELVQNNKQCTIT
jgi:hypothetical protein